MAGKEENTTIIIKKVVKGGGGHHGGAWKVAYADFVTAMMAFFLLLWLLNVTTSEQKAGIADYFTPTAASRSTSGSGMILGGRSLATKGAKNSELSPPLVTFSVGPPPPEGTEGQDEAKGDTGSKGENGREDEQPETASTPTEGEEDPERAEKASEGEEDPERALAASEGEDDPERAKQPSEGENEARAEREPTEEEIAQKLAEQEQQLFEAAERELRQALQDVPDMEGLAASLIIDNTPEGLRIQIVDQDRQSMFPSGSSDMLERMHVMIEKIAQVVKNVPNRIAITGHTDATPFKTDTGYGNWELSTDRANASRRALLQAGLLPGRISYVTGKAATEPLIPDDPTLAANRRISIVLLRERSLMPTATVPTASVPTASVPTATVPTVSVPTASVPTATVPETPH
jgi:chemotaxis protein MotB